MINRWTSLRMPSVVKTFVNGLSFYDACSLLHDVNFIPFLKRSPSFIIYPVNIFERIPVY